MTQMSYAINLRNQVTELSYAIKHLSMQPRTYLA